VAYHKLNAVEDRALSQTSAVDPSGSEPDIAFIQEHQKEAER